MSGLSPSSATTARIPRLPAGILAPITLTVLLFAASADAEAQLPPHLRDYPRATLQQSGDLVAPFFSSTPGTTTAPAR